MTIADKKKKMLAFTDFYGGDIPQTDEIEKATTDAELEEILSDYFVFLENQQLDALAHMDDFRKSLSL